MMTDRTQKIRSYPEDVARSDVKYLVKLKADRRHITAKNDEPIGEPEVARGPTQMVTALSEIN
jgi:hypothetical protein